MGVGVGVESEKLSSIHSSLRVPHAKSLPVEGAARRAKVDPPGRVYYGSGTHGAPAHGEMRVGVEVEVESATRHSPLATLHSPPASRTA